MRTSAEEKLGRMAYVVDDDEGARSSLQAILAAQFHLDVRTFESGDSFLVAANHLEPGLALVDFHMPGLSGLDVLEALKNNSNFIIAILTGQGNIALSVQAMKAGAHDFVEKPYSVGELGELIESGFAKLQQSLDGSNRASAAAAKIATLAPREQEVLAKMIEGHPNKVIAFQLGISQRTVEFYRANAMLKLGVKTLSEALRIAFTAGMLDDQ